MGCLVPCAPDSWAQDQAIRAALEQKVSSVPSAPNTEALWAAIRDELETTLKGYWRNGALMGKTPRDAAATATP